MSDKNENKKQEDKTPKKVSHFFKTPISGLSFQVAEVDPENPVAPKVVRFVPYIEVFQGDRIQVGYLETADEDLAVRLMEDSNVEEISAEDFKKATQSKSSKQGSY